jgi:hypothetical protein
MLLPRLAAAHALDHVGGINSQPSTIVLPLGMRLKSWKALSGL